MFLDVDLRGSSGMEAARRIRALRPGLMLVALTTSAGGDTREAGDAAGISAFLPKPLMRDDVAAIVNCI